MYSSLMLTEEKIAYILRIEEYPAQSSHDAQHIVVGPIDDDMSGFRARRHWTSIYHDISGCGAVIASTNKRQ
jgi:hypothetical protein